jgi:hypothetical protein
MARREARIVTTIWGDPAWRSLSAGAQWLYLFLISQPDIAHDGVISLRERRWAKNAEGVTPGEITAYLKELDTAGYVLVDEATEEVLVRSFMRHDQVYLQPNLMSAAVSHLGGVESHRVRRAIYSEVTRIVRENGDRGRAAAGLRPLTEKQKIPIRQMIAILRRSGDGELAIEGPKIQPVDLPEEPADDPVSNHPRNPSRAAETSRPRQGTRPEQDDLRSLGDPLLPAETQGLDADLGAGLGHDSHGTRPRPRRETRPEWVKDDTPPYDVADPLPPAEVNPSANPSGKPLEKVSVLSPLPLPLTPTTSYGHDLRSTSAQGDLLDEMPVADAPVGTEGVAPDPLLDDLGFTPTPEQVRTVASSAFERFWDVYPLKVKKGYARQCWDRAVRRASPEKIIRGAKRYAEDPHREDAYTAHPSSWLNQDRWDDAPLPPRHTNGRPAPGANARAAVDIAEQRRARRTPGGEITNGRR